MSFEGAQQQQVQPPPPPQPGQASQLPPVKVEPISLTGSVPKVPADRRPSIDAIEYELFRDTGGQMPELSQPGKLSDSFPPPHEFLLDLHGGAATPPMRSPPGVSMPNPFARPSFTAVAVPLSGARTFISPPASPHQPFEPRLSSFAFPPQPHAPALASSAVPDSGGAFRPQRAAAARVPPPSQAKGAAAQLSQPSSPDESDHIPPPTRKKGALPAEEKARVRAEQSRISSRSYRQRKKAYQQNLEAQIDNLKSENSTLRKELEQAREMINKLQHDVAALREGSKA